MVAIKPKEAKVPLYSSTRPTLTRSKLRRSQLLSLSASSNTDVLKLRQPEEPKPVDQRAELTSKLKKSYTKSETVITPKQFVLPTIDDKVTFYCQYTIFSTNKLTELWIVSTTTKATYYAYFNSTQVGHQGRNTEERQRNTSISLHTAHNCLLCINVQIYYKSENGPIVQYQSQTFQSQNCLDS